MKKIAVMKTAFEVNQLVETKLSLLIQTGQYNGSQTEFPNPREYASALWSWAWPRWLGEVGGKPLRVFFLPSFCKREKGIFEN